MPVSIHGVEYATVAERLKLAHGEGEPPTGIHRIETKVVQIGSLTVIHASVTFKNGQQFDGSSLVNLNATGPAERDAPLETAETSAVGRALAMAGYPGSEKGIAGAEEIALAQRRSEARRPDGSTGITSMPTPGQRLSSSGGGAQVTISGPTPAQVRYLNKLWGEAGRPFPPPNAEGMARAEVSKLIDELQAEVGVPSITQSSRPANP